MTRTEAAAVALQRRTRRPTGKPSWPILLIAGREKAGKSWSCAEASGSDLVGRALWIGVGEDDPDEYALIPDADFEIVEHDGTYRDILAALTWAAAQRSDDGRPVLLVLDSASRLWDLLCDMAQDEANARAARKAAKERRAPSADDADIAVLEWNVAAGRWANVMDVLRAHQGPSLVTARLEEVTVMGRDGKPTTEKTQKVKGHKSLPYDVGGIVELPERGSAFLTGVRTARMEVPSRIPLPGFTVDKLWRRLGLAEVEVGERRHAAIDRGTPEAPPAAAQQERPQGSQVSALDLAVKATKTRNPEWLTWAARTANADGLIAIDVASVVTEAMGQLVDVATGGPVTLAAWLEACARYVDTEGHSVADGVAMAAAADDPWALPPRTPDESDAEHDAANAVHERINHATDGAELAGATR